VSWVWEEKFSWGRAYPQTPLQGRSTTIKNFQHFDQIISYFIASIMHNACTIICLTKAEVLMTLLLPQPKFPPRQAENLQRLLIFLQQKTAEKMHSSRSSRSTTYSYSRYNVCVCARMCEHESACVCIVHANNADYIHP